MSSELPQVPWPELASRLRPFIAARVRSVADAQDVEQEVLLRMHRALPDLEDEDRLVAWMYRIARNAIIDHQRAQRRATEPLDDDVAHDLADASPAADQAEESASSELSRYLGYFVALLPTLYRQAITLTEIEGRSQREAAEMLGISTSTMKSRVQRGRAKLLKMLDQCCEIALDARNKVIGFEPRECPVEDDDCCS